VVENAADVFNAVPRLAHLIGAGTGTGRSGETIPTVSDDATVVLEALSSTPAHPDDIADLVGLAIEKVLGAVVELEISALVVRDDAGNVSRMKI